MKPPGTAALRMTGLAMSVILAIAAFAGASTKAEGASEGASEGSAATALDWNIIAVNTVRAATPPIFQVEGLIYMSYVQASVYDAVTKIEGRYQPYHHFRAPVDKVGASPTRQSPQPPTPPSPTTSRRRQRRSGRRIRPILPAFLPRAKTPAWRSAWLQRKTSSRSERATDATLPSRTPYGQGPLTPGVWIFAPPPSAQSAQTPWVAFMKPFMLRSPSQFRPGPPLQLTSKKYATQLAELQAYGSATSTVRTDEQTKIAEFWNANAINQINQTQRDLDSAHGFDLVETARGLAMANLTDSDAGIACFDAKYYYTFWRPVTAIQHADIDGNPLTTADPTWTPLLITPNHPEYPAAHGCLTSSDAEVAAELLGTHRIEINIAGAVGQNVTTLTTSRHYATVEDLDRQVVNARVWAGLHFRELWRGRRRARSGRGRLGPRPVLPAYGLICERSRAKGRVRVPLRSLLRMSEAAVCGFPYRRSGRLERPRRIAPLTLVPALAATNAVTSHARRMTRRPI